MNQTMMVRCDNCGRPFSLDGVAIAERWEGEYQIFSFCCPMCGAVYCSGVTDEEHRENLRRQIEITKMLRAGTNLSAKFRKKKVHERQQLREKARDRQKRLTKIGKLILSGVSLEEAVKQADSGKGE